MNKIVWQAPGNSKIFDSNFEKPGDVTSRTIKVLQFFYELDIEYFSSVGEVERNLIEYLTRELEGYKPNKSIVSHFYKPLIYYGLLQKWSVKNECRFSLTASGITLLKEFESKNFNNCTNIFFMSLFNVKYPNDATPQCELNLYPFKILFYLLNKTQYITKDEIIKGMCYINNQFDLDNFEVNDLNVVNEVANHFLSWVINSLRDVGILEMHKDENKNYQYALSDNIKKDYQKYIEKIAIDELFVKNNDLYDEYIEIKQDILSKFQRDKRNALAVIEQYGRQCFMDNGHESFDNLDNLKYVEVHHIIPFSLSDSLDTNLDVEGNLICLCPNCHKKMHYSNYESKKTMIDYIWNMRSDKLTELNFSKLDLLKIYLTNTYLGNKNT